MPTKKSTVLVALSTAFLLASCSSPQAPIVETNKTLQQKQVVQQFIAPQQEATIDKVQVSLHSGPPFRTENNELYNSVFIKLENTSNEAIQMNTLCKSFRILDESGKDITKHITLLTNAMHGADLGTLDKLKPQQFVNGSLYYQAAGNSQPKQIEAQLHNGELINFELPKPLEVTIDAPKQVLMTSQFIEDDIKKIRNHFNKIEDAITANQMAVKKHKTITTYTSNLYKKVVYTENNMTYSYYFSNDELFFVYSYPVLNAQDHENRYYFNKQNLIRWIQPDGTIIDQPEGKNNAMYKQEARNILQLAKNLNL